MNLVKQNSRTFQEQILQNSLFQGFFKNHVQFKNNPRNSRNSKPLATLLKCNTQMILGRITQTIKMAFDENYVLIFKIYITISYFPVVLAAIQKKNEVDSENNGQNRIFTVSANWLS